MAFCSNCGRSLEKGIKFCSECGEPINKNGQTDEQRKIVYDGELHKCPNCGEVLKSFEINCSTCGYELRDAKVSSAVREFALKLEKIESSRESKPKRKNRLFITNNLIESYTEISKTDEQKISLIKSFSVPNSKEDILEFMILAISNIDMSIYDSSNTSFSKSEKAINDAWVSKVQQVYEKAKRICFSDDIFTEIKTLYDSCNKKIKKAKKKGIIKSILLVGWIPLLWIIIIVAFSISAPKDESKELQRLENIVAEVQVAIDNKEYKHALRIADSIDYQRYDAEMERKWDIQRKYWVEKVLETASQNGVVLEYTPSVEIDNANGESSNEDINNGFVKGFKEGLRPGIDSAKENIDVFNQQMEGVKEQWNSIWNEDDFESIDVKGFTFNLPKYWNEEGSKNEYLQYYAEKGDKVAMLSISYPEEADNNYDVSFKGLEADNDNMVKAVADMFTDGDVVNYEVFESNYGVKGMLYHFTYKQEINWLTKVDGSGYCFCFPAENDRRWFYVILMHTNNIPGDDYKNDFIKMLAGIKAK